MDPLVNLVRGHLEFLIVENLKSGCGAFGQSEKSHPRQGDREGWMATPRALATRR